MVSGPQQTWGCQLGADPCAGLLTVPLRACTCRMYEDRFGTPEDPIVVPALGDERIIGVTDPEDDNIVVSGYMRMPSSSRSRFITAAPRRLVQGPGYDSRIPAYRAHTPMRRCPQWVSALANVAMVHRTTSMKAADSSAHQARLVANHAVLCACGAQIWGVLKADGAPMQFVEGGEYYVLKQVPYIQKVGDILEMIESGAPDAKPIDK